MQRGRSYTHPGRKARAAKEHDAVLKEHVLLFGDIKALVCVVGRGGDMSPPCLRRQSVRSARGAHGADVLQKNIWGSPMGKTHLARRIVAEIPEHRVYVEPFAGQSDLERRVYDRLSGAILAHAFAEGRGTVAHLILVGRQRQLSSSLVAALRAWKNSGLRGQCATTHTACSRCRIVNLGPSWIVNLGPSFLSSSFSPTTSSVVDKLGARSIFRSHALHVVGTGL